MFMEQHPAPEFVFFWTLNFKISFWGILISELLELWKFILKNNGFEGKIDLNNFLEPKSSDMKNFETQCKNLLSGATLYIYVTHKNSRQHADGIQSKWLWLTWFSR